MVILKTLSFSFGNDSHKRCLVALSKLGWVKKHFNFCGSVGFAVSTVIQNTTIKYKYGLDIILQGHRLRGPATLMHLI